jgi:hypothetical protein
MHPAFRQIDHRPWPVPERPWAWRQTWRDLLFAHWPIPTSIVRSLVPDALEIQEFEGTSWIGVVPFKMSGVMRRPFPDLPWISAFPELNLRVYVQSEGMPGVWFLSLDAGNALAVWAARRWFHLPYFHARMAITRHSAKVSFRSCRVSQPRGVEFIADYEPTSGPYLAKIGTLEHWLTERYCLYAQTPNGEILRAEIHHAPWPLQRATATIERNDLFQPHGVSVSGPPTHLHFSRRLEVVVWQPRAVGLRIRRRS